MPIPPAHSYRGDAAVPSFPDDRPLIVFDGVCALCSGFVRFVLRHDPAGQFRFAPAQSALGAALYRHYGLDPYNWQSNLLIAEGRLYLRSEAALEIVGRFSGLWRLLRILRVIPRSWRDRIYDVIAGNRYRWFGRHDYCAVPTSPSPTGFWSNEAGPGHRRRRHLRQPAHPAAGTG